MNKRPIAKAVKQIYETKEYDRFKIMDSNRPINRLHVENLKKSMTKEYLFDPIQVDGKGEIVDGQHRYTAIKELGLPLRYYIDRKYNTQTVATMNNLSKKWVHNDYAMSYSTQGNNHYALYKEFRNQYPNLSHGTSLALLGGHTDRSMAAEKHFTNGTFEVKQLKKATEIAEELTKLSKIYPQASKSQFMYAVIKVSDNPEFDFKKLSHKISKKSELLRDYSQTKDYVKALEDIYNWNSSKKVRFY